MNEFGMYQLDAQPIDTLTADAAEKVLYSCPFSDQGPNEDEIGQSQFCSQSQHDPRIGYYEGLYIGHVAEGSYRERGTSGGILTWVLTQLLNTGKADGVIHVKKVNDPTDGILFRYGISRTPEEVLAGAKSRYYPVEMSRVLDEISQTPGRYVLVGLPCFLKAARRLVEVDSELKERLPYFVGLVCGHLKSRAFADCFAWQAGIPPGTLEEIDFRVKLPNRPASDYGVFLRGNGVTTTKPTREFLGSNWGHNMFRYSACDYCDDVFAEVADLAVGDAWLPGHKDQPEGASVVVVRHPDLQEIVSHASNDGRLNLISATTETIAESQAGGLRDRREGLAYRLSLKQEQKLWTPRKRVAPDKHAALRTRRTVYRSRLRLMEWSHIWWKEAIQENQYDLFSSRMQKVLRKHNQISRTPIRRVMSALKRKLRDYIT